jgi:UDP-N-acetyl-2-amino-2-deoxyglucuronate dehydrogenase
MELIVVGAGWAGERHVLAAQALESQGADVHVAALVDVDDEHLRRQARTWSIEGKHTDLTSALDAQPQAKGVVLATPHHLHRHGAEQAAEAGRHVLVEKPMALTLPDADAMIEACSRAGTTLMVAESVRYGRPHMAMAEVIRSGRIGQVLSGWINRIGTGHHTYRYPGRRAWLADPDVCGGGIWMLNGIHTMSGARMLLGEVTCIDAREVHSPEFESDLEATVVALVNFDSGAVITMTVSAELHGYGRFGGVVLLGSDGTLAMDPRRDGELQVYRDDEPEVVPCGREEEGIAPARFVRQMQEFLDAAAHEREPFTSGRVERGSLAAIVAGYESIRSGRPVIPAE